MTVTERLRIPSPDSEPPFSRYDVENMSLLLWEVIVERMVAWNEMRVMDAKVEYEGCK